MKRTLKTLICLLLCIAMMISFASCEIVDYVSGWFEEDVDEDDKNDNDLQISQPTFPEGYTGGSRSVYLSFYDVYWVETVDELIDAVSRLEAHGSTVDKMAIFDFSEDEFDFKFMISIKRESAEPLSEGQNEFDRKCDDVEISWFAFDDYITIDELLYTYAEDICKLSCTYYNSGVGDSLGSKLEDVSFFTMDHCVPEYGLDWPSDVAPPTKYVVYCDGQKILSIGINEPDDVLPKETALSMLSTFKVVGNKSYMYNDNVSYPEDRHRCYEVYWLETYEELMAAIDTLKAHGSTVNIYMPQVIFDIEGVSFNDTIIDCKYTISFDKNDTTPLEEGQGFFERKVDGFEVSWYAFDRYYHVYYPTSYRNESLVDKSIVEFITYRDKIHIDDIELITADYGIPGEGFNWIYELPPDYAIYYDGKRIGYLHFDYKRFPTLDDHPSPELAMEMIMTIEVIK